MTSISAPLFLSTAISYPNGAPHIGHAYELIGADVLARFFRLDGRDVFFQTGTDEHGLKMVQTAARLSVSVQELADTNAARFQDMVRALDCKPDLFIRTTQQAHAQAVQALWQAMAARGDIYLDRYEGWYSVRDEAFYSDEELIMGEGGERLAPTGTPVEWTREESYFFRLSNYQDKLLEFYASNPDFIQPASRRNEIVRFVEAGLRDLSISRTSFRWGVGVPGDARHVMYVWVDALTNYITGCGYPELSSASYKRYWQQEGAHKRQVLHIIGKDIVRFHAIYWPAFLMSANIALPTQVFGHGFLTVRGEKMSKSLGNVIDPFLLVERYGAEVLRYVLMRDISWGGDGSYSDEAIVTRANADLSNSFGNLAQRTLSFAAKNLGRLPVLPATLQAEDSMFLNDLAKDLQEMLEKMRDIAPTLALEAWLRGVFACNAYIDKQAPWTLRKSDPERMEAVLACLFVALGWLGITLMPITPKAAQTLLDQLGIPAEARSFTLLQGVAWYHECVQAKQTLSQPVPLFPRLELPCA
jgi:methionyl-tRNA synthetase